MADSRLCSIPDCGKPAKTRGYCISHYKRLRRHGDPLAGNAHHGQPLKWLYDHAAHQSDECLDWPFSRAGNGRPNLKFPGGNQYAARFMCTLAHGAPPTPKHQAAHNCGRGKDCVNPRHLRWATAKENAADKKIHGTYTCGESHHISYVTEEKVRGIRAMAGKAKQSEIAEKFGTTESNVWAIIHRRSWAHVD